MKKQYESLLFGKDESNKDDPKRKKEKLYKTAEKQIHHTHVALTKDDFLDFNMDMSTGVSDGARNSTAEQLLPIFDRLKLEPTTGCLALLDMPAVKEEKSIFNIPEPINHEAGQDDFFGANDFSHDDNIEIEQQGPALR